MANIPIYIPTYISDQNYNPSRVLPRLLFYNGMIDSQKWYIESGSTTVGGTAFEQNAFPYFDNYNVVSGSFPTTDSKSLLFYNEAAVYGEVPTETLYSNYWEKYVELLYNPRTRLLNASTIIPLADYFKMELNDIVELRGNYYHLRAINDYNLKNGECNIQLLGPILSDALPFEAAPTTTSTSTTSTSTSTTSTSTSTTSTSTTSTSTTSTSTTTSSTTTTTLPPADNYYFARAYTCGDCAFAFDTFVKMAGAGVIGNVYREPGAISIWSYELLNITAITTGTYLTNIPFDTCANACSNITTTTTTTAAPTYNYYNVTQFTCPSCTSPTGGIVARNNTTNGTLTTGNYYNNGDGFVYRIDGYNAGTSYTINLDGSATSGTNCSATCAI